MKRDFIVTVLIVGAVSMTFVPKVSSADDDGTHGFEAMLFEEVPVVVISAMGREQKQQDVSQPMTVLTQEDIRRSGAKSLSQLFLRVPGMQVRSDNGYHNYVSVRGEAGTLTNNLLVLVDGAVVFNPAFNGTRWHAIPVTLDEIERVEIIRGPGGVLYASNAVLGVVNIITKSSRAKEKNSVEAKGGSLTYNGEAFGVNHQFKEEKWGVRGYGQHDKQFGWDDQHGVKAHQRLERYLFGVRSDYQINDQGQVSFSARGSEVTSFPNIVLTAIKTHASTFLGNLDLNYKFSDFYDMSLKNNFTYHIASILGLNDEDTYTNDVTMQNNFTYDLMGDHVTSLGTEYRNTRVITTPDLVRNTDYTHNTTSFFLNDEYKPSENWVFTAGVRADKPSSLKNNDPKLDAWLLSERVSGIYKFDEHHSVSASVTSEYRFPSYNAEEELYWEFFPGFAIEGNINLEPEKLWNYDLGYHGLFLEDKLNVNLAAYFYTLEDVIVCDIFGPQFIYRNHGEIDGYGVELDSRYHINNRWSVYGDYSYILLSDDKINTPTPYTALQGKTTNLSRHMIGSGARYTAGPWEADFYVKYFSGLRAADFFGAEGVHIDGYWKPAFRAAYSFKLAGKYDTTTELVVNDFFNSNVYETVSRYEREAQVFLGVKVLF
ncbi:MAG: TonB-dependent receptor [Candidatus Omnitrophica bacterium]|nr:TonB-dependent receptor [Candidatus Omnitrophota bacterium]